MCEVVCLELRTRTTWTATSSRTTHSARTSVARLLVLLILVFGKYFLQLLFILLALFEVFLHLLLLSVCQLRALRALLSLLGGGATFAICHLTTRTNGWSANNLLVLLVQFQHLCLLFVSQLQVLCHSVCQLGGGHLLRTTALLVVVTLLSLYSCHRQEGYQS